MGTACKFLNEKLRRTVNYEVRMKSVWRGLFLASIVLFRPRMKAQEQFKSVWIICIYELGRKWPGFQRDRIGEFFLGWRVAWVLNQRVLCLPFANVVAAIGLHSCLHLLRSHYANFVAHIPAFIAPCKKAFFRQLFHTLVEHSSYPIPRHRGIKKGGRGLFRRSWKSSRMK